MSMNIITFDVLRLLKDGKFKSGDSLAQRLSCTRATIINSLKNVDSCGIEIAKDIRGLRISLD